MERLFSSRRTLGTLLVLSTLTLAACNSLTGADRLVLDNSDPEGQGGDGPGRPSGSGAAPSTNTGGSPETGGSDTTTTTSSTTTSTSTPTTTTTSTTTSTTTTTTTDPPTGCGDYPSGSGIHPGDVVNGNLSWQGYSEGASMPGTVSIQDYFDCDGSKGINAILIDTSAVWCGACQQEAQDLPTQEATFQSKGIRVITLLIQDNNGQPATVNNAKSWRSTFGLQDFAVVADPNFTFGGQGSVGLPLQIIVDPRTMQITDRIEGFGDYNSLLQLAQKNAN